MKMCQYFDVVQKRTEELAKSLRPQTANLDVPKHHHQHSTFDLQTSIRSWSPASRLCERIWLPWIRERDEHYRQAAVFRRNASLCRDRPIRGRTRFDCRPRCDGATVHIPDVFADPEYKMTESGNPRGCSYDTWCAVLREGTPSRLDADRAPITDKQVELVGVFADQHMQWRILPLNSVETRTRRR